MHPWFDGLDWGMLLERRVRPPLTPDISNPLDTQNFDKYDEHDNDIDEFEQPLDALDELFMNY
jgi:protein kinase X